MTKLVFGAFTVVVVVALLVSATGVAASISTNDKGIRSCDHPGIPND